MKKVFLKLFAKFKGKNLCRSLFFNKIAGPPVAASMYSFLFLVFVLFVCFILKKRIV